VAPGVCDHPHMGQLIAFPTRRRAPRAHLRMALEVLYGLAYALGYFLVTPVLVLVVLAGAFDGELAVSAGALVLLAVVIPLATAARRSIP
jgi:hypothetical protein